jgi:hypothetical protein
MSSMSSPRGQCDRMTFRTRGQSGSNTETSVTASKSTLLHTLLLKSRRTGRAFENRREKPGTGTTLTMTSGAVYPPDRRPPSHPGMTLRDSSPTTLRSSASTSYLPITVQRLGMSAGSMRHGPMRCRPLGTWTRCTCAIRTSGVTVIAFVSCASVIQSRPSPPIWWAYLPLGFHTVGCHPNTASR